VSIEGAPGDYLVQLEGADADHMTRDVTFENVVINGERLMPGQSRLQVGRHVENVRFTD
jgi:hypothetical protein